LLDDLHQALFDRDAAVRLTIVETLAVLGRQESVPFLEQLAEREDEGKLIPRAVQEALRGCRNGQARDVRLRSW
jgi:HEAT repeat protein